MTMDLDVDDVYDLLGGQDMPVRQNGVLQALRAIFHVTLGLSGAMAFIVIFFSANWWCAKERERKHKKSIRRKYGIPDDDNDPFNVAYAKVLKKGKGSDEGEKPHESSEKMGKSSVQEASSVQRETGRSIPHRRVVSPAFATDDLELPGDIASATKTPQSHLSSQESQAQTSAAGRSNNRTGPEVAAHDYAASSSQHQSTSGSADSLKRSASDISRQPTFAAPDTPINVAEQSREHKAAEVRGAKRQAASDDDISIIGSSGKKAGKRARRQSRKLEEVYSIDENDEQMDVDPVSRGRKRDRVEAGSSFEGDDEMAAGTRGPKSRRQKRQSSISIDMDPPSPARGKKRSFDAESTLGSDNDEIRFRSPRKRGKRMPKEVHEVSSTESELDAPCAGRSIGEEWHANGVTFKVGRDGHRLRQVLLRKRASRFSMPEDSDHPDSRAGLEILVETWLNDDDFKASEMRGEIYIPNNKGKESGGTIPFPRTGKSLLWSNKMNRDVEEISSTSGTFGSKSEPSPFVKPSLNGSPSIRQSKSYSKWEKQDLEANALAKLRKQLETSEKKVISPPGKKVSFQLPPLASDSSTSAPSITISASAPATFPGSSGTSKAATSTPTPSTFTAFIPPAVSPNVTKASASSQATPASATTTSQINPAASPITLPQHAKVPSPMFPPKVPTPSGSQPAASLTEKKEQAAPINQPTSSLTSTPQAQNLAQAKASTTTSTTPANIFAKPGTASQVSSSTPNGASANKFNFGFKAPAQGEKPPGTLSASPFIKPADKPASSAPSPFGVPAKNAGSSGTSSPFTFGPTAGSAAQASPSTSSEPKAATPQTPFGFTASKPADSSSKPVAEAATKPLFGFGVNSTASSSTNQNAPAPAASKPATTFNFGPSSSSSSAPSGSTAPATASTSNTAFATSTPRFPFGPAAQSSSSTTPTTTTPSLSFGVPAAQLPAPTDPPPPHSIVPKPSFGTPAFGTQSSSGSAPAASTSTSTSNTGSNTGTVTNGASSSNPFNFAAPKPATSTAPSASPFSVAAANSNPAPFTSSSSSIAHALGSSPSPFGATSSPFGGNAFKAGSSSTTAASPFSTQTSQPKAGGENVFKFGVPSTANSASSTPGQNQGNTGTGTTFKFAMGASPNPTQNSNEPQKMFRFGASSVPSSSSSPSPFGAPAAPAASGNANTNNATGFGTQNAQTNVFGSGSSGSSPFTFGGQQKS